MATDPQRFRPDAIVPNRIRMIKEGVDWLLFAPASRLTFPKNVIRLVYVAKKLVDSGYRFKMIITGKGYLEGRLRKIVKKLGLAKYIVFDYISEDELPYFYAISDVVVYPSLNEPFGLAVVEAMASGTAPVVANTGGPSETVIDGVTGIHVEGTGFKVLKRETFFTPLPQIVSKLLRPFNLGGKIWTTSTKSFICTLGGTTS